jgi:hypothetical protein
LDLSISQQSVQSAHSSIDFQHQYPIVAKDWNQNSNYLVFLSVKDESELICYINKFANANLKYTIFREPDIDNQITAITVEPSEKSRKLTSNLPLLFKNLKN